MSVEGSSLALADDDGSGDYTFWRGLRAATDGMEEEVFEGEELYAVRGTDMGHVIFLGGRLATLELTRWDMTKGIALIGPIIRKAGQVALEVAAFN